VQNGGEPLFYTNLDTAIIKAHSGDTIYLPGYLYTPGSGNINIDKELHIIGTGHHPDSTFATGFTQINGNITLIEGSSNGSIEGIFLSGHLYFGQSFSVKPSITGFILLRNSILAIIFEEDDKQVRYTNNVIKENILRYGIRGTAPENSVYKDTQSNFFFNNLIMSHMWSLSYNNIFKNNIFIRGDAIFSIMGCLFENNIFPCGSPKTTSGIFNCTFRNNLSTNGFPTSYNGNIFINNITESLQNIFINYPYINQTYSYDFDFHLQPTSKGKNAGRDGTDVGIYGGNYPWKDGSLPFNPHYQKILIAPQTDNQGNLNVNIKVKAQDH
jgi:hypothetical protein